MKPKLFLRGEVLSTNTFRLGIYRAVGETEPGLVGLIGNITVTPYARPGEALYDVLESTGLEPEWMHGQKPKPQFWIDAGGLLLSDQRIEGVTQDRMIRGTHFVCRSLTTGAAKRIAEALGGTFRDDSAEAVIADHLT